MFGRLGELIHPLDHPAFVAVAVGGQLLGMLTYVPEQDRRQCEILILHASEQWRGAGTALLEEIPAVGAYGILLRDEIGLEKQP